MADRILILITRKPNCSQRIRRHQQTSRGSWEFGSDHRWCNLSFQVSGWSQSDFHSIASRSWKTVGQSTIYAAISIPIVNLAEIEVGSSKQDRSMLFLTSWLARPSAEARFEQKSRSRSSPSTLISTRSATSPCSNRKTPRYTRHSTLQSAFAFNFTRRLRPHVVQRRIGFKLAWEVAVSFLLIGLFLAIIPGATHSKDGAKNWPQFRGPSGDGYAYQQSAPIHWDEQTNIAWKIPIPGKGHSSPVVRGDQLWLTTARNQGRQLDAICVDIKTGAIIHHCNVFENNTPQPTHLQNSHASPTPVIDQDHIYIHFGSYGTACLDRASGQTCWIRRDLVVDHRHGPGSSPILADNQLVLQFDGMDIQFLIALDKKTGRTIWRQQRDIAYNSDNGERKKSFCTPLLISHDGSKQLVTTAARSAIAYNPADGNPLWRVRFLGDSATARPVLGNGIIYLTTSCVDAKMLAINPTGRGDITETGVIWRLEKGVPQRPSPLYIDGLLYCIHDNGVLTCRDATTSNSIWRKRIGGNYAASPIYVDNRIYLVSESGKTFVIAPGQRYQLLVENQLDDGCIASPAVADNAIFLRTLNYLYRIGK